MLILEIHLVNSPHLDALIVDHFHDEIKIISRDLYQFISLYFTFLQIHKSFMLVLSIPFGELTESDLDFEVRIRKGYNVWKARGRFIKFSEVPDKKRPVCLYFVLESEERLACQGVRHLHLDVDLFLSETKRTSLVDRVDDRDLCMVDFFYNCVETVVVLPLKAALVSEIGLSEDGDIVRESRRVRSYEGKTEGAEGVERNFGSVRQRAKVAFEDGGEFMRVDIA